MTAGLFAVLAAVWFALLWLSNCAGDAASDFAGLFVAVFAVVWSAIQLIERTRQ